MNNNCHTLKWNLLFLLFFPFFTLYGQTKRDTLSFRIVSYNVENLFDCRHDTLKNDYEFLPDAMRHWNYTKYKKKLDGIARTITAVGGWTPPALVALCEVENESVLRDLTRRSVLKDVQGIAVQQHSADVQYITCRAEFLFAGSVRYGNTLMGNQLELISLIKQCHINSALVG